MPTVREGSPANTTITGDGTTGTAGTVGTVEDDAAADATDPPSEEQLALMPTEQQQTDITAPSPAPPPVPTAGTELSIEVGDENEQFELQVDSPFKGEGGEEEVPEATTMAATAAGESKQEIPSINAALSKESARSAKSNKSSRSTRSSRSVKTEKAGEKQDVAAAPSIDAASIRSTRSNKSTSSKRSLMSIKLKKSSSNAKKEDEADKSLLDEDEAVQYEGADGSPARRGSQEP